MTDSKRKSTVNVRELILEILMEVTAKREYSHVMIRNVLDKYDYLDRQDKAFLKRCTEGTIERMIQIDYVLNHFSKVPVSKMKPVIRGILRLSVYQIMFMDSIPDSAVCNEAVKLAEKKHFVQLKGFVNGVLRNVARQKDTFAFPTEKQGGVLYLSVNYSIPEWLIEKWIAEYGYSVTKKMAASLLLEHPVTVRIHEDLSKEEKQQTIDHIMKQQIEITQHPYLPYAYWIEGMNGAGSLPGFKEGKVTIQDVSSMMAVQAAGIKSGMHVIDVCAAPGGKAMHAASKLKESGLVEARDVSNHKVAMIEEQIARCRYKNITASILDARNLEETSIESADVVLLDVPCSGLGVIGKKRDIKYRVTKESLKDIVKLQKEIVQTVWQYVKKGGTLIYSTCTLNKEENEQMVEWMTHSFPLMLGSIDSYIPEELHCDTTAKGYLQFMPGVHETDGFFVARMKRTD